MDDTYSVSSGRGIAWLSLVFSVIALLFAVSAYGVSRTRAGETDQGISPTQQLSTTTLQSAKTEARDALLAVRLNLHSEGNYAAAAVQLRSARDNLHEAYGSMENSEPWQKLDTSFEAVEVAIRERSASALTLLESLITQLAEDVRKDDDPKRLGE